MRTVGLVSVGRSDFGIYRPILRAIADDPQLTYQLILASAHLASPSASKAAADDIEGFHVSDRIEMLLASDSAEAVAKSIGLGTIGFAQAYAKGRPDVLLLVGDRFEMLAAAGAALPFNIPIAHVHGGELTEGAVDEQIRHALTKMSHLHFVATNEYARRVMQMGEEPWRVTVSGAPALDNLRTFRATPRKALSASLGVDLSEPTLLITYHPETIETVPVAVQITELLAGLDAWPHQIVFTRPNADANNSVITRTATDFVAGRPGRVLVDELGTQAYFSLMTYATAMVGNSSSGIIEASSFQLPVVNVGDRQRGRVHPRNVLTVPTRRDEIRTAIAAAATDEFRTSLIGLRNPYGDGSAASRIATILRDTALGPALLKKRFSPVDQPAHA